VSSLSPKHLDGSVSSSLLPLYDHRVLCTDSVPRTVTMTSDSPNPFIILKPFPVVAFVVRAEPEKTPEGVLVAFRSSRECSRSPAYIGSARVPLINRRITVVASAPPPWCCSNFPTYAMGLPKRGPPDPRILALYRPFPF